MKLVIFSGPVCSGKTTIANALMQEVPRYFHLSYDAVKWQFSQYSSGKYYEDILTLRLAILRTLCEMKYNVLTETTRAANRKEHIDIVKKYGYEIIEINLETDQGVLLERLERRNALAEPNKTTSLERFNEVNALYEREKNPNALTFRTDHQSLDALVADMVKFM